MTRHVQTAARSIGASRLPLRERFACALLTALVFGLCQHAASAARADEKGGPTYEREIRPLLAKRCTICHNAKKVNDRDVSAGLALDSFEAIAAGTKEHRVLAPGKASESEIYRRICEQDEDKRMPLNEEPLAEKDRELLRRWIDAGAPRGERSAANRAAPDANARPARRVVRTLDVVVPIETKVPANLAGMGPGGAAELRLKVGPLPAVSALAFRADGLELAVGTAGEVVLWDLAEARPARVLGDIPGPVHALGFSRDGRRLAVGSGMPGQSGSVRVYTVPDGTLLLDLQGHDDVVYALAYRRDGGQLATAGFDQTVRLWNAATGQAEGVFHGHSDFVYDVAYTLDGRTLLSASKDRSVKRFDATTGKGMRTYSDHDDDVLALAVTPDGSGFVSAGNEPQLRWWTLDGEKPAKKVGGHSGPVHQLAFSGNGKRLISASGDKTVRLWDGASGVPQKTLPGPTEWQYAVALSSDARLAAAGGWDGLVRVWDAESGQLRATLLQPAGVQSGAAGDWLVVAPSGVLAASAELIPLLRWRIGGAEVRPEVPLHLYLRPAELGKALGGEAVASPFPSAK